jgi:hypothetical protein
MCMANKPASPKALYDRLSQVWGACAQYPVSAHRCCMRGDTNWLDCLKCHHLTHPLCRRLTEMTFAALGAGRLTAVLSTITVTELLVQPFAQAQDNRVSTCEHFIQSLPNTTLIAPDYNIAKASARLRATYNLRTPDAILMATALEA